MLGEYVCKCWPEESGLQKTPTLMIPGAITIVHDDLWEIQFSGGRKGEEGECSPPMGQVEVIDEFAPG